MSNIRSHPVAALALAVSTILLPAGAIMSSSKVPQAMAASAPTLDVQDQTVELGTRPKLVYHVGNTGGQRYKMSYRNMSTSIAKIDVSGYINTYSTGTATVDVVVTLNDTKQSTSKRILIKVVNKQSPAAPAHTHSSGSPSRQNEVAATCTNSGSYDEVTYCTGCGQELSRHTVQIPALGHDFTEWHTDRAATCTNGGTEVRTCRRCGHTETRHTNALGHAWGEWTVTRAAQIGVEGQKKRVCQRDSSHVETERIAALSDPTPQQPVQPTPPTPSEKITPNIVVTNQVAVIGRKRQIIYRITNNQGNKYKVRFKSLSPRRVLVDSAGNMYGISKGNANVEIFVEDGGSGALNSVQATIHITVVATKKEAEKMQEEIAAATVDNKPSTNVDDTNKDDSKKPTGDASNNSEVIIYQEDDSTKDSDTSKDTDLSVIAPHEPADAEKDVIPHGKFVYIDASKGNDNNKGSLIKPLKTIDTALNLIAKYRGSNQMSENDEVVIVLRGGVHLVNSNTGTRLGTHNLSHIRFFGFQGEQATITSANLIKGFQQENQKVNGQTIWKISGLPADTGTIYANPNARGASKHDVRVSVYPDNDEWLLAEGEKAVDGNYANRYSAALVPKPSDVTNEISRIRNTDGTKIRILNKWHDDYINVSYESSSFKLAKHSDLKIKKSLRYRLENAKFALSQPGEYYLQPVTQNGKESKTLYYVPYSDEDLSSCAIYVASEKPIFTITGSNASGISFENVYFRWMGFTNDGYSKNAREQDVEGEYNTMWIGGASYGAQGASTLLSAVSIEQRANGISFRNCKFSEIGGHAIRLGKNVSRITIENCDFNNIGGSAVFVGGAYQRAIPSVLIKNNRITKYGQIRYGASAIQIMFCTNSQVLNNDISDAPYSGISCGWQWGYDDPKNNNKKAHPTSNISIANNCVHDIGAKYLLCDMAGIYTLGPQKGTRITNNIVYNINAPKQYQYKGADMGMYGGIGIYLDEGSSNILVEKNLVYGVTGEHIFLHYGENNTFKNNVVAMTTKGKDPLINAGQNPNGVRSSNHFISNVFVTRDNWSLMTNMNSNTVKTGNNQQKNIVWNITGKTLNITDVNKTTKSISSYANDFVAINPSFRNPDKNDYTIQAQNLGAYGFTPFNYSAGLLTGIKVGIQ